MDPIVVLKHISFSYGTSAVLSDVSLSLSKGEYVALAGPNGAGKTTLIRILLGLESSRAGIVQLFGKNISKFSEWWRIGYVPQRVNAFNPLFPAKVHEVVGLGLLSSKRFLKYFTKEDHKIIRATLDRLGIAHLETASITELSGGQQQRVFLAQALVSEPELLVLDEPNTALDPQTREYFFSLVQKLNKEKGTSILIVTHDTSQIGKHATRLVYLDKKIIFDGSFHECCKSEEMKRYFGHASEHLFYHS